MCQAYRCVRPIVFMILLQNLNMNSPYRALRELARDMLTLKIRNENRTANLVLSTKVMTIYPELDEGTEKNISF